MQKYKFYIGSDSGAFGERYREYIFYFLGYNFEQAKYKAEKYVENLNRKWDADADLSEYFYLIKQEQRKRRKNKNNSGRNEMKIIYLNEIDYKKELEAYEKHCDAISEAGGTDAFVEFPYRIKKSIQASKKPFWKFW